jgi:heme oxygenase
MMDGLVTVQASIGGGSSSQQKLSEALRDRTRTLHVAAERSGIIGEILRGGGTRYGYGLLLSNLLPAYCELERGLDGHVGSPIMGAFANPALYRTLAIESDLIAMAGPTWRAAFALLPEGRQYAERIAAAAGGDGIRLIAHAYLRYLGDLSGGQIMKRLLAKSLGLDERALRFYDFPGISEIAAFKVEFRNALDRCAAGDDVNQIVDEAIWAFKLNIALSEAVNSAASVSGH